VLNFPKTQLETAKRYLKKYQERRYLIRIVVLVLTFVTLFLFFPKIINIEPFSIHLQEKPLNKEFLGFINQKKSLPLENTELSLAAVGDVMLSRTVADKINRYGNSYPFLGVNRWLSETDVVFGNLETPLTPGRRILPNEMVFRSDPALASVLNNYNFSLLSLANNHTMNFGDEGIRSTFLSFRSAGLDYVGAGENFLAAVQPKYLESQGIKLAFLAYNDSDVVPQSYAADEETPGTVFMDVAVMTEAVRRAKQEADFVIVSIHSGQEYADQHNQRQEDFSKAAIDSGAELVIGHHPHVIQDIEVYKGKLIFYSLGNFIFDQMWSEEVRQSLGLKIYFTPEGISRAHLYPFRIDDYSQPVSIKGEGAEKILRRLQFNYESRGVYMWDKEAGDFKKEDLAVINLIKPNPGNLYRRLTSDLNQNGLIETLELKAGSFSIEENGQSLWSSPDNWWVEDFSLADSNGDGFSDINISAWRQDQAMLNYFMIYSLLDNKVSLIWESEALEAPVCRFLIRDFNEDGTNDFAVLEGDYNEQPECLSRNLAVWSWNGASLKNIWRIPARGYSRIAPEGIGSQIGFSIE